MKRYLTYFCASLCVLCAACSDDSSNSGTCGNGKLDGDEVCDGSEFATDARPKCGGGMTEGNLVCNDKCEIDVAKSCISGTCNNGKLDDGEECDGEEFAQGASAKCGDGKTVSKLVCSANCTIDNDKSCVTPSETCHNGKLDEGEQCDGDLIDTSLNKAEVCGKGKTLTTAVCNDACQIDVEKSCTDDDASLIFTQIAYSNRQEYNIDDDTKKIIGGEMLFEVSSVGDGKHSSHCGLYWLQPNEDNTEWKAIKRVYSFKDMESGTSDYICSKEYDLFKDYDDKDVYDDFLALKPKCAGHIVDDLEYQQNRDLGLGIVCDDSIPEALSSESPYTVKPIEVIQMKGVYYYGQRRCDKTEPLGTIDTSNMSILEWLESNISEDKYERKVFVDDVGEFKCIYMEPILSQVVAGEYGDSQRYSALEIVNVGLGSEPGKCALYYYMRDSSSYSFPNIPTTKIAEIPSLEPFKTYTICSESTKDYLNNIADGVATLKAPCDLYIPDSTFDYILISQESGGSVGLNCNDIQLVDPSEITPDTKGVLLGDSITIKMAEDTTRLLAIHNCKDYKVFNNELDSAGGWSGNFTLILKDESAEIVKAFANDFGAFTCPLTAVSPQRCGNHIKDDGEDCDGELYYDSSLDNVCTLWNPEYVMKPVTYGTFADNPLVCTDACKVDYEQSCTKCGNGVIDYDDGELCDSKPNSASQWAPEDKVRAYCESLGLLLNPKYNTSGCSKECVSDPRMLCLTCGNNRFDEGEACDTVNGKVEYDLEKCDQACSGYKQGYQCISKGSTSGRPKCTSDCKIEKVEASCWSGNIY